MRAGYGVFFPQADVGAGATRQLVNLQKFGSAAPGNTFNLFTVSGTVSYAIDIWGGERRQVEALRAVVEAQGYALTGAYLMLSSNVVDAVVAEVAYRAQVDATRDTILLEKEQVKIAQAQASAGVGPYSSVASAQSQLAATEATLPPLLEKIDQTADLLAMLTGRTPGQWHDASIALEDIALPSELPLSLPSELVRQRPDVLISEAQLHESSAQIGVATAAMLPSLTLSATYGDNALSPGGMFGSNTSFWNIGAGLTAPVFHGGTLSYQRKAAVDAYDQALAQYRGTVLSAFEQVADVLRALEHDADAVSSQDEAVKASSDAVRLLQANYAAGVATYLQVLVADTQYLTARIGYVGAVAERLQDTVALYTALGGGWWNAPKRG
jgi:NodT family efflux transporter outer membrane factor (OMF) lipoprotein